ncbi:MAG: CHASE2 domain-containing protein, partial [Planctomycetota bacterium]
MVQSSTMQSEQARPRRFGAVGIGLCAALPVAVAVALGALDGLDTFGRDLHFRYVSRIEDADRIVLIDVDDASLRAVGEWPWPRRRHAQLVDLLHDAGAEAIVLDFAFAEPTAPRIVHAGWTEAGDIDHPAEVLGNPAADRPIFDDDELRDALRRAGNVYLAMFSPLLPPGRDPAALDRRARQAFDETPSLTFAEFVSAIRKSGSSNMGIARPADETALRALYDRVRIERVLEEDLSVDGHEVFERLGRPAELSAERIAALLAVARRHAARRFARRFLV